ncbi:MAG TPA: hypothetical protein VK388_09345 [Pyrinomonadaceae bacterium]|nr:hypothetical protein [Pyrinomonadaceae bacterium]
MDNKKDMPHEIAAPNSGHALAETGGANELLPITTSGLTEKDKIDFKLRKYVSHYERYNAYMDIAFKANVFFYVVTGSILGFYLANSEKPYIKIALLLPMLLGTVLSGIFLYGSYLWWKARRNIKGLEDELIENDLIIPPPDLHLLTGLLLIFGTIFLIVALSMIVIWNLI